MNIKILPFRLCFHSSGEAKQTGGEKKKKCSLKNICTLILHRAETPPSIVALIIRAHIGERDLKKTSPDWEQMSDRHRLN